MTATILPFTRQARRDAFRSIGEQTAVVYLFHARARNGSRVNTWFYVIGFPDGSWSYKAYDAAPELCNHRAAMFLAHVRARNIGGRVVDLTHVDVGGAE